MMKSTVTEEERDLLLGRKQQWLGDREAERVESLEELLGLYRQWLYLEETEDIEVALATLLDREIPGDPIWLQIIASSGDKKTEIIRSFKDYHKAYTLDTLTTKALVSGLAKKNKESGELEPVAGLIFKIDGKVLVIKDFTTTLGRSEEYRTELYGQLRSIYDGYYEVGFGTMPDPIRVRCRIGLLAACTPVIDRYTRLENALGTRFLKVRSNTDPEKATIQALENAMKGERMRTMLRAGVENYINTLIKNGAFKLDTLPKINEEQKRKIIKYAMYISKMRASVWGRWDSTGNLITIEAIDEEKPTRVAKQLMKLAVLLAIIRGQRNIETAELTTLRRVAKDTAEPTRQKIIDTYHEIGTWDGPLSITDIDALTKKRGERIHYVTARNELEIMDTLGIVKRGDKNTYTVTETFKNLALVLYPLITLEKKPKNELFSQVTRGQTHSKTPTLTEDLEKFHETLSLLQRALVDEIVPTEALMDMLEWQEAHFSRIMGIARRDRTIYEPRIGYLKLMEGAF